MSPVVEVYFTTSPTSLSLQPHLILGVMVREIQRQLKTKGIKLTTEADAGTTGPASLSTTDPDGNVILLDQHR